MQRPSVGLGAELRLGKSKGQRGLRSQKARQARILTDPRPARGNSYLGELLLSADFRSARGVIETTLYSRSLSSASSTCSSILSL
jgi:hypothetical protein